MLSLHTACDCAVPACLLGQAGHQLINMVSARCILENMEQVSSMQLVHTLPTTWCTPAEWRQAHPQHLALRLTNCSLPLLPRYLGAESAPAGACRAQLMRQRDTDVAALRRQQQQRIAPALRRLKRKIDAAKCRCNQLENALRACPDGRMLLLMTALTPAASGSWLLHWLQRCLMAVGSFVLVVLLFSACKLCWVGSAAAK